MPRVAELEGETRRERQQAGMETAKARGVYEGWREPAPCDREIAEAMRISQLAGSTRIDDGS
jgi:DNA invertase Pin-like site-specific DNA recombinase